MAGLSKGLVSTHRNLRRGDIHGGDPETSTCPRQCSPVAYAGFPRAAGPLLPLHLKHTLCIILSHRPQNCKVALPLRDGVRSSVNSWPADPVGGQAPALGPFHGHEGRKRAPAKKSRLAAKLGIRALQASIPLRAQLEFKTNSEAAYLLEPRRGLEKPSHWTTCSCFYAKLHGC